MNGSEQDNRNGLPNGTGTCTSRVLLEFISIAGLAIGFCVTCFSQELP